MTDIYSLIPSFNKLIPKLLNKNNSFVILGVTGDQNSTSYKILTNLKNHFSNLYIICAEKEIDGEKCYKNLESLPQKPDAACIATPPDKTLNEIKKCIAAGINMIWIELGSETKEAIDFCKKNNIDAIYYHSIIKELIRPTEKELKKLGKTIS